MSILAPIKEISLKTNVRCLKIIKYIIYNIKCELLFRNVSELTEVNSYAEGAKFNFESNVSSFEN